MGWWVLPRYLWGYFVGRRVPAAHVPDEYADRRILSTAAQVERPCGGLAGAMQHETKNTALAWATALALALVPVAFLFGALGGMAEQTHPEAVAVLKVFWLASWTATPLLALAGWLLRRRPALISAGRWAGWIAVVPVPVTILLACRL